MVFFKVIFDEDICDSFFSRIRGISQRRIAISNLPGNIYSVFIFLSAVLFQSQRKKTIRQRQIKLGFLFIAKA